jgi:C4-dicarboxylate-specific signal transduction histidine kinase
LAVVQTNYAERVNLKTISEQNDIISLKDQVLGKQRTITVLAMVIALLLLGFTYFAIQSGRTYSAKLKRHNEELEQKVLERTMTLITFYIKLRMTYAALWLHSKGFTT